MLNTFDADGDDVPLMLARSWADSTFEMLELSRKRRRDYRWVSRSYDRMDGDAVDLARLQRAIREVWSTDCLLIISAANLEAWTRKLYRARRRREPKPLENLKRLRNAIEHLDEADIDEETWIATARNPRALKSGIGALPNQKLGIGVSGDGLLFGVMSYEDLENLVNGLLGELSQELDDYARDWFEFVNSGR
ncbi:hypothetical protein AB0230_07015 [Microbacterium sp. NPDC089190]|uniref:hypothetical protein n=1 Tax=Microbacterium sp. NPDC089190 TaxID=3155063 RepID=UPI00344FBD5E